MLGLCAVFASVLVVVTADISGTNPKWGTCLCLTGTSVNARSSAGLSGRVVASLNRGECYKYAGLKLTKDNYSWYKLQYGSQAVWTVGKYLEVGSSSQCSATSGGGGSGCGRVDYRGYTISDSKHDVGRAADFWIDGQNSGAAIFQKIKSSGILARDYQVIWHGQQTCTGGEHIHIGRYTDNRSTCWVYEGTKSSNYCSYVCGSG